MAAKPAKPRRAVKLKSIPKTDAVEHDDGYVNALTGIGDRLQDKTQGGGSQLSGFMLNSLFGRECEDRWRGSDLGARIVECIPDEMIREGWEVSIQPEEDAEQEPTEPGDDAAEPGKPKPDASLPTKTDAFPQAGAGAAPMMPPEPTNPKPIQEKDTGQETIEELEGKMDDLGVADALWLALAYERAFGGAAILLGGLDGQNLTWPLAEDRIEDITHLNVFTAGRDCETNAYSWYTDMNEPKFGQPETYLIRRVGVPNVSGPSLNSKSARPTEAQFIVHESRLLVFNGNRTSRRASYENLGFGDSVFTRVDEILSQYGQTWGGIAVLMTEFSQAILKVPGFRAALAMRNKAANANPITARALAIQQTRSLAKMLFIDGDEEFERNTATLTGISDVLEQFALRLAAAADMPVTLLMGQAPAGLNATGQSDIQFFYDRVAAKQKRKLLPQLKRLIQLLFLAKEGPTKGVEPGRWTVKFNPLYQATEKEQAEIRKLVAETDQIYINAQVLSPEEVAASAYGGSEWTMERTIDFEGRDKMAAEDAAKQEEKKSLMSEAASKGVDPGQLALNHPEHPLNLPKAKSEEDPKPPKGK